MKMFANLAARMRWCPRWWISGAVVALILWLTLAPQPVGETELPLFEGADKVVHGLMFGFLALCLWFDAGRRGRLWKPVSRGRGLLLALGSGLFGLIIEYLQMGMQLGRSFEWADVASDFGGCLIAGVGIVWISRRTY